MEAKKTEASRNVTHWLFNTARGFLMGTADIVPGVSGGTIALVVGIYEHLVTSISRFDTSLMGHLRRREWAAAARHIDMPFLVTLGMGIVLGIVTLGSTMEQLLVGETSRPYTLATFFGLILGSAILVARLVDASTAQAATRNVILGFAGVAIAFWITCLPKTNAEITLVYVFVCGMIGICAMILPGISGAYILLILGLYSHLTGILHRLAHIELGRNDVVTVCVFCAGCAVGLISFSKLLKWLLATFRSPTMAILCGFMIGALRKVWPFQRDLTREVVELKSKEFVPILPEGIDGTVLSVAAIVAFALASVLAVDWVARRKDRRENPHVGSGASEE